jgi:hypothetical protein
LPNSEISRLNIEYEKIKKIQNQQKEQNENSINLFKNIGLIQPFQIKNIFGPNIVTDSSSLDYGRHIMAPRSIQCSDCQALMWEEERT